MNSSRQQHFNNKPCQINTIKMCHQTLSNETMKMPKLVHSKALSTTARIVPTFPAETAPQHMDVSDLTSSDLASLKRNDPFMYYSIPLVKNAALHCKDVSMTDEMPNMKCSELNSTRNLSTKVSVMRQRRISMECHPDLLMEEMFTGDNLTSLHQGDSYSDDADGLYDFLLSLDETLQQR